jgi:Domain of unknown function (DUF4160)
VPCICEFEGIAVYVYHRDHSPPHFHVRFGGAGAEFDLATLRLTEGTVPRAQRRKVEKWAREKQAEIRQCWDRACANQPPGTIG